jgi:hypothetical protein
MSLERAQDRYSPARVAGGPVARRGPGPGRVATRGRGRGQGGQATKGVWGMSGRQEATKGVEDCDKPGGTVKRVLIPGCPNQPALNP